MNNTNIAPLLLMAACITITSTKILATDEWSGTGEVGLIKSSGNSDNENFNVGLAFERKTEIWEQDVHLKYFKSSSDGIESADTVSANYQAKRSLSEKSYVFAGVDYLDDSFDGFTEQFGASLGYGYRIYDSEPLSWEVGIGIGYRDTSELITLANGDEIEGKDLSGATLVLRSEYAYQLTDNSKISDDFRADIGSDNSFIENNLALTVAMNDQFALKAGVLVRHNTDPAPGKKETDTVSSINLVYNF